MAKVVLRCSFCGKGYGQVAYLLVSRSGVMCDECVTDSMLKVAEKDVTPWSRAGKLFPRGAYQWVVVKMLLELLLRHLRVLALSKESESKRSQRDQYVG